jgi:hypothetical protein
VHWLWLACADAEHQHGLCACIHLPEKRRGHHRSSLSQISNDGRRYRVAVIMWGKKRQWTPQQKDTSALQCLEVTVPSGTGTVSISSSLSSYFGPFTLSSTCCFSTHSFLTGRSSSSRTMASTFKRLKTFQHSFKSLAIAAAIARYSF